MKQHSKVLYTTLALACALTAQSQVWLGTNPSATTAYGGALIDFTNESSQTLQLTGKFGLNLSGPGGIAGDYYVFVKPTALSGLELDATAWTLLGSDSITSSQPFNSYTTIDVGSTYLVNPGQTIGLAFFQATNNATDGFVGYSSGGNVFSDGTAKITTGLAKGYRGGYSPSVDNLFNVDTFSPRTWSGQVEYQAVPEPSTMALIGLGVIALIKRRRAK